MTSECVRFRVQNACSCFPFILRCRLHWQTYENVVVYAQFCDDKKNNNNKSEGGGSYGDKTTVIQAIYTVYYTENVYICISVFGAIIIIFIIFIWYAFTLTPTHSYLNSLCIYNTIHIYIYCCMIEFFHRFLFFRFMFMSCGVVVNFF